MHAARLGSPGRPGSFMRAALLSLAVSLSACGGSGGGAGTPPPTAESTSQATSQDTANANAANLSAGLDLPTNAVTLTWTDTFPTTSGYQVEQQADSGAWTTLETVPGQQGSQKQLTWTRAFDAQTTVRVEAAMTGYTVPLETASQKSTVDIAPPLTAPAIELDTSEPLSGTVGVSISKAATYLSVEYFVDLNTLANSSTPPSYGVALDTNGLTSGQHLILARLYVNASFYIELRRTDQVASPEVAVQISVLDGTAHDTAPVNIPAAVVVTATSEFPIQTVTAAIDGISLGSLTSPTTGNKYGFSFQKTAEVSGAHTITAEATDSNGRSATATEVVNFDNPPVVTVSAPIDGVLVNNSLHVAGTFGSDKTGAAKLVVSLGNVPILTTTSATGTTTAPFAADFSLAGVTPGTYTLTLLASDITGETASTSLTVTVTPLVYVPLVTLGYDGALLAEDGSTVLYRTEDQKVHLRSPSGDLILDTAAGASSLWPLSQWQLGGGNAFAIGLGPEAGGQTLEVFRWASNGSRQDLGPAGPTNTLTRLRAVHFPWLLWDNYVVQPNMADFTGTYTFYNVTTAQSIVPTLTNPTGVLSNIDFYIGPAGPVLYYESALSANPGVNPIAISRWDAVTAQSTALATGSLWQLNPQTDATRVAWQTSAPGMTTAPFSLVSLDIASNAQTTLSTTMSQFQLADGVLAWMEGLPSAPVVKASDGITITTVASLSSAHFYGTGGGYVLFGEGSKLYLWNAANGRQLILDATPGMALMAGKTIYFTNGVAQTVYAVTEP